VWRSVAALAVGCLLPDSALATSVLFSQPPVDGGSGYYADSYQMFPSLADDFVLEERSFVTELCWWGSYLYGGLRGDDFVVDLYRAPLAGYTPFLSFSAAALRTPTALREEIGSLVYEYRFELTEPLVLEDGVTYYFGVRNYQTVQSGLPVLWFWQSAVGDAFWYLPGSSWAQDYRGDALAFQVVGEPVPEPGTGATAAIGLTLLALARRALLPPRPDRATPLRGRSHGYRRREAEGGLGGAGV
jgi:hypothetical protein